MDGNAVRLSNLLSTFMGLMYIHGIDESGASVFYWYFVVVYFNNILVYSHNDGEHVGHLKEVLKVLKENKFYINLKKCSFLIDSVIFLGYVMSAIDICVDEEKVKAINEWPIPKSVD